MCFVHAAGQSVTSRRNAVSGKEVWLVTYGSPRPQRSLVKSPINEVGVTNARLPKAAAWVKRG